jgi:hypothetical protein
MLLAMVEYSLQDEDSPRGPPVKTPVGFTFV